MNFLYLMMEMKIKKMINRILVLSIIFCTSMQLVSYAHIAKYDDVMRIYNNTSETVKSKLKNSIKEMVNESWTKHYQEKYKVDADILKNMDLYYVGDQYVNKNYKFEYAGVSDISEIYMAVAIIDYYIDHETYNKYAFVSDDGYYEEPTEEMQKEDLEMIKDLSRTDYILGWLSSDITSRYINSLRKYVSKKVNIDEEKKIKYISYDFEDKFVAKAKQKDGSYKNYYEDVDKMIDKYDTIKNDKNLLAGMRYMLYTRRYGSGGIKEDEDLLQFVEYLVKEGYFK